MKPRPYQKTAIDSAIYAIEESTTEFQSFLILLATGAGKTPIYCSIINEMLIKNQKVNILVLTHNEKLVEQGFITLKKINPRIHAGVYAAGLGSKDIRHNVIFATIQSAASASSQLMKVNKTFDLIIIDECHRVSDAKETQYATLLNFFMAKNPSLKILGLTATPYRQDCGWLWESKNSIWKEENIVANVAYGEGLIDLFKQGYLVRLTTRIPPVKMDLQGVKITAGDYKVSDIENKNGDEKLQEIVQTSIPLLQGRKKILVFVSGIKHAMSLTAILQNHHETADCVHGKQTAEKNNENLKRFVQGQIRFLVGVDKLTTGFDCPEIDAIIMCRPTRSTSLHVQMLGRGTRPAVQLDETSSEKRLADIANSIKPDCLVLDFTKNVEQCGSLAFPNVGGLEKKDFKICGTCFAINNLNASRCHVCKSPFKLKAEPDPTQPLAHLENIEKSEVRELPELSEVKNGIDLIGENPFIEFKVDKVQISKESQQNLPLAEFIKWALSAIEKKQQGDISQYHTLIYRLQEENNETAKKLKELGGYDKNNPKDLAEKLRKICCNKQRIAVKYHCDGITHTEYLFFDGYDKKVKYPNRVKWQRLTGEDYLPLDITKACESLQKKIKPIKAIVVDTTSPYKNIKSIVLNETPYVRF